jgi:hypothetical protein
MLAQSEGFPKISEPEMSKEVAKTGGLKLVGITQ